MNSVVSADNLTILIYKFSLNLRASSYWKTLVL